MGGIWSAVFCFGGKTGIRTLGARKGTTVFETAPIDHSGIFPYFYVPTIRLRILSALTLLLSPNRHGFYTAKLLIFFGLLKYPHDIFLRLFVSGLFTAGYNAGLSDLRLRVSP